MNETIYAKHLWKIKDISIAFKYHLQSTPRCKFLFILARILAALIILLILIKYIIPVRFELAILIDIAEIIACLFLKHILIYLFSYSYRNKKYENKQIQWEISSDEIIYRMINLFETKMNWDLIQGVLDTPECFLIYPHKQMFYWLPKYAFKSEEDIAQFVYIAQNKVKDWQHIK